MTVMWWWWWWWWISRIHSRVTRVTTLHQLPLSPYYLLMDWLLTCLTNIWSRPCLLREMIENEAECLFDAKLGFPLFVNMRIL